MGSQSACKCALPPPVFRGGGTCINQWGRNARLTAVSTVWYHVTFKRTYIRVITTRTPVFDRWGAPLSSFLQGSASFACAEASEQKCHPLLLQHGDSWPPASIAALHAGRMFGTYRRDQLAAAPLPAAHLPRGGTPGGNAAADRRLPQCAVSAGAGAEVVCWLYRRAAAETAGN